MFWGLHPTCVWDSAALSRFHGGWVPSSLGGAARLTSAVCERRGDGVSGSHVPAGQVEDGKPRPRGTLDKCVSLVFRSLRLWDLNPYWGSMNQFGTPWRAEPQICVESRTFWSQPGLDLSPGCALMLLASVSSSVKWDEWCFVLKFYEGYIRSVQSADIIYQLRRLAASNCSLNCFCCFFLACRER